MLQSPANYIFFKVDKEYADKIRTESGYELDLIMAGDPGYELRHVREFGKVIAVPFKLHSAFNTTMDVLVGDRIYFHFHTVEAENRYIVDGEMVFKVHYSEVYCAVRNDEVIMLNDFIFCEPVMESEDNLKTPSGIWLKDKLEPLPLRATISKLPKNRKKSGDSLGELNVGDKIIYSKHSDVPIVVEGNTYYRMKIKDALAIYG